MLCFIPIFISRKRSYSTINRLKYFISQRAASLLFIIFYFALFFIRRNFFVFLIMFKIGMPPFQRWIISIISVLNVGEIYLLLSIQKFIPIVILSHLVREKVVIFFLLVSIVLVLSYVKYLTSLIIILFISSVINSMWVIGSIVGGGWFIYFFTYCLILGGLVISLWMLNVKKIADLKEGEILVKIITSFHLFNIGGVPPILGFIIKLLLLLKLFNVRLIFIGVLLFSSFVLLIIYTLLIYQVVCISPSLNRFNKEKSEHIVFVVIITFGLIMWPIWLV